MTTVLVVDDSAADRKLAAGLIGKRTDWSVEFATNGREALDRVEALDPDLVLTDLQMPELDGLQLVTAIHADDPMLPVVLMTATGSEEIAVRALREGAASYVPKRNLGNDLVPTLERVLQRSVVENREVRLMDCLRFQETRFELGTELGLVTALVRHLQQGVGRSECLTIATALDEALVNAYFHGNLEVESSLKDDDERSFYDLARRRCEEEPYASRRIHVTATVSADEARYVIRDEGPGFDPSTLPDPTDPANLERAYGRGLLLMRTFMDEVTYNETGNEVTLVKHRTRDDEA